MKKVLIATIAAAALLAPAASQANDFWNIAGGIVVGGLVLDGLRDRHRDDIYYTDDMPPPPPPMRRVMRCHDEFTLDQYRRKHWFKVCTEEWIPAY